MNIEPIAISVNSAAQTLGIGRTSVYALLKQGRTAERVMIHADSRATNPARQKMMYVGISRAKTSAAVTRSASKSAGAGL